MGLQHAFDMNWGYDLKILNGPDFADREEELFIVIDNHSRANYLAGIHTQDYVFLLQDDFNNFYLSSSFY